MRVLPIASGKGGVGKSLVAANLAILLAKSGKRVVLIDLDLGGSNLHTILGMRGLPHGVGTFLAGKSRNFETIVYQTEYENLRFVPGDAEIPGMANLTSSQKQSLIRHIERLEADYAVVDLGSGSNYNTVDFFLASPNGIVVTTPNLTAILNAYLFLKNSVFRMLMRSFDRKSEATKHFRKLRKDPQTMQRLYIPSLVEELYDLDPDGVDQFRQQVERFRPSIILNMLEDPRDAGKAGKIRRSCKQYLGLDVEHLGVVYRDTLQNTALQSGLPIVVYKPESVLSRAIIRITEKIIEAEWNDEYTQEYGFIDDGYETAESEAEADFEMKIESIQDLVSSGALSQGDLIETIRAQQYELGRLRRENTFLKTKLVEASKAGFNV